MAESKLCFKIGIQLISEDANDPKVVGVSGICQSSIERTLPANLKDMDAPQIQMLVDAVSEEIEEKLLAALTQQVMYRKAGNST